MPREKDAVPGFIEPMQCLQVDRLPEGPEWIYEIKLDGYRAQAICDGKAVRLLSRNGLDLAVRFPTVASALSHALPNGSVVDGELVALGPDGKPSFSLIQNSATSGATFVFFAFDLMRLDGEELTLKPLSERRNLLRNWLLTSDTVQLSEGFQIPAKQMLASVREHGLEGVVAKRLNSCYERGKRTGAWVKMRVELAQEFVLGGYTPGTHGFDAVLLGFYRGENLHFCASVRNGFVPASRRALFPRMQPLVTAECPFVNLPEASAGRWGQGLTAAKMQNCVWLRPETVAQFRFLEWTPADHLRHVSFIGVREDKHASQVVKEGEAIPQVKAPARKPPQAVPKKTALRRTR
ncbi:MAG: non-homologous end-joining DNA ligase [Janthinobacterium lividum]